MSEQLIPEHEMFYDPFAEQGEKYFDPNVAHQSMLERYAAGDVEHDYTADKFVADTEALMLDAQFVGQFEQVQLIAQRMHMLCGEDHGLQQSIAANGSLSGLLDKNRRDEHNHDSHALKNDEKDKKSKKKKKLRRGWFSLAKD